jgi:uncharacterized protein YeaO (DUF488 family)
MLQIKHLMDRPETDDGLRLWVEPFNLTRDLAEWCKVDHALTHLGPPMSLWNWFEEHPDGYDYFRAQYHAHLSAGPYKEALEQLAVAAQRDHFTLLHQGDNPQSNTATALYEFITELEAYLPRE